MNIFRFLGDLSHIVSFLVLLHKIVKGKSSAGISLRTQELYAIVFCARYVDLFWNFSSMYNWVLKICFISASLAIVYFMRFGTPQKATYNADQDAFPIQYLIGPCALLGLIVNQDHYSAFEIVWAFSVYLEAVAILPQLFLLQKLGEVENLTSHYVFALGAYRGLYLLNWLYRFMTEEDYLQRIVWVAGIVQTGLYCDFFYHYYESKKGGMNKSVKLPV
jgi:ER lumen protein retaining receptor